MLKYDLSRAMKRHRLENANQLAVFAKIPPPLAYRLLSGEPLKRVDVATLETVATAFGVKPLSLLKHE
jgi:hypothetical protein